MLDFFLNVIWLPIGASRTYGIRTAQEAFWDTCMCSSPFLPVLLRQPTRQRYRSPSGVELDVVLVSLTPTSHMLWVLKKRLLVSSLLVS